jgi:hypothetical protein
MKVLPRSKSTITRVSLLYEATTLTPTLRSVSFLYEATSGHGRRRVGVKCGSQGVARMRETRAEANRGMVVLVVQSPNPFR